MSAVTKVFVRPVFYLRAASLLTALLAVGHSLGGLQDWSPIGENETLRAMREFVFDAEGARRSYLDFYLGFGWTLSTYLILQTVLLWQMRRLVRTDLRAARRMTAAFAVANMAAAGLAAWFILAVPAISFALIAACLIAALAITARSYSRA